MTAPADDVPAWWIYRGDGEKHEWMSTAPPPWREFDGAVPENQIAPPNPKSPRLSTLAAAYRAEAHEARLVNTALRLRRPLLVTGKPGTGKSMLSHSIAHELGLGRVLQWSITSRSTLEEGLYQYDAIGRLQDVNLHTARDEGYTPAAGIGRYLRLGPLGTALLPADRPRVLLIDEIDKSDVDLPNGLLHAFEEGSFSIKELLRLPDPETPVEVLTDDGTQRVPLTEGTVTCREFPIVVMTSNGERDFPPAFLRRCIRLELEWPEKGKLENIVRAHLQTLSPLAETLIERVITFREENPGAQLAIDQLLNAIQLEETTPHEGDEEWKYVLESVLRPLNERNLG